MKAEKAQGMGKEGKRHRGICGTPWPADQLI